MFLKSSLQVLPDVRTRWQQKQPARCLNPAKRTCWKMHELKDTLSRNAATLPRDFAGVAALAVIAFVGLSLPGMF